MDWLRHDARRRSSRHPLPLRRAVAYRLRSFRRGDPVSCRGRRIGGTGSSLGRCARVTAGDILMLPHGGPYSLHDGSGAPPAPARYRESLNLTISENAGTGERLDMLCGRFALTPTHDRLLRTYVAPILVVSASGRSASTARPGTDLQLAGLVNLIDR